MVSMKHMKLCPLVLVGIIFSFNTTTSQTIGLGYCPEVNVKQHFFVGEYLDQWYEYKRYPTFFEFFDICVRADYYYDLLRGNDWSSSKRDQNGENTNSAANTYSYDITVKNSAIRDLFFVKHDVFVQGKARKENPFSDEAKLVVNFNGKEGQYWILETDYKSFSLVWSCIEYCSIFHLKFFWVLTRLPNPTDDTIRKIDEEIAKRKYISRFSLSKTKQYGCSY